MNNDLDVDKDDKHMTGITTEGYLLVIRNRNNHQDNRITITTSNKRQPVT